MPRISNKVIKHCLNISPKVEPVVQKKRNLGKEQSEAMRQEVNKLLDLIFIREVCFLKWLVNVVMVRKARVKG